MRAAIVNVVKTFIEKVWHQEAICPSSGCIHTSALMLLIVRLGEKNLLERLKRGPENKSFHVTSFPCDT